jgi:hypothetical protein
MSAVTLVQRLTSMRLPLVGAFWSLGQTRSWLKSILVWDPPEHIGGAPRTAHRARDRDAVLRVAPRPLWEQDPQEHGQRLPLTARAVRVWSGGWQL